MMPIDIGDIVERLLDLRTYSPELAKRMDHENELPEDEPIPFLIERIETSLAACENVTAKNKSSGRVVQCPSRHRTIATKRPGHLQADRR
jgi:hypothetical protein